MGTGVGPQVILEPQRVATAKRALMEGEQGRVCIFVQMI